MTAEDILYDALSAHLKPIIRRMVHPETTYNDQAQYDPKAGYACPPSSDIKERYLSREGYQAKYGKPPLEPRKRLSARLTALLVLTRLRNELMKEILADKESIADAKAHGVSLEGLIEP